MDCKIIWTDSARDDLKQIVSYIAGDNPEAARRVGMEIYETVSLLASFPMIGPPSPRGSNGKVREIVSWSYRIFYRINAKKKLVEFLTIWHGAQGHPCHSETVSALGRLLTARLFNHFFVNAAISARAVGRE